MADKKSEKEVKDKPKVKVEPRFKSEAELVQFLKNQFDALPADKQKMLNDFRQKK